MEEIEIARIILWVTALFNLVSCALNVQMTIRAKRLRDAIKKALKTRTTYIPTTIKNEAHRQITAQGGWGNGDILRLSESQTAFILGADWMVQKASDEFRRFLEIRMKQNEEHKLLSGLPYDMANDDIDWLVADYTQMLKGE